MDRIADFNISSNRQRHRNTNSCNVVINNNHSNSTPQFRSVAGTPSRPPDTVVYPSVSQSMNVEPNPYENTQVMERDVVIDDKEALNGNELDLYKKRAGPLQNNCEDIRSHTKRQQSKVSGKPY